MKKEPISLNELPYDGEFLNALSELELRIVEDFKEFSPIRPARLKEFADGLGYMPGTRYLKIVKENKSVWGFINLTHPKFKEGDILKLLVGPPLLLTKHVAISSTAIMKYLGQAQSIFRAQPACPFTK